MNLATGKRIERLVAKEDDVERYPHQSRLCELSDAAMSPLSLLPAMDTFNVEQDQQKGTCYEARALSTESPR